MYRILIADDEGIVLESVRSVIQKAFPGQFEVATAKSGRAAIEQAEIFHPDIVYMDIQMPGINGIQAMQEIRRFNRSALLYVISAYDKFDYAMEAIQIGVERYLTKPFTKDKVIEVTREAMDKVDEMRRKRSSQLAVQEKLEAIIPVVENGFVSSIIIQNDGQDAGHFRQLLDIEEERGYVCVFQFGTERRGGKLVTPVGASIQAANFYDEFRAIVKSYLRCMIGSVISDRIIVVVPCVTQQTEYEQRVETIEHMHRILDRLQERLQLKFRIGIGRVRGMEDLRASYQDAVVALQGSQSRIAHVGDISFRGNYEEGFPIELEKKIFQLLDHGDVDGMRAAANAFFDWMIQTYPQGGDSIRLKVLEYVIWAERDAFDGGAINYGFSSRENYLTEVIRIPDYETLRVWFLNKLSEVCSRIRDQKEEQSETVVSKARSYIEENFRKDISLDDVSRMVNVSPYYFSKLFKEEAGENFIEYLTRVRMEHAKHLLEDRERSIKEISLEAGYADPNYFSRLFKKQTGMTPREYREKL